MEIILVRHGESEADILNVHEGRADFSLTSKGRQQAEALAEYGSKHFSVSHIYSSTLKRAKETADIINHKLNRPISFVEDLMEWNNGVLAGLSREEAMEKYPEPKGGRKPHEPIEEGESYLDFRLRAERVFSTLRHKHADESIMIVSHGGAISNMLNAFYQMPVVSPYLFSTGDTGFHLLAIKNNERLTRVLNCQVHLIRK
ncbi:histidine phosphatase family protein [Falsibacillus albus]|uniref:Histidine phosphatase family protein n=1 Tax=Falsibacillus albus TaxID=2478915 RepID=A0A3L7K121_9BACI|nr:histidine phosphatase family protein [Falsibacillus albus]RLQ96490.1 histidine phosphatase family protein [Falsibacillus albus]